MTTIVDHPEIFCIEEVNLESGTEIKLYLKFRFPAFLLKEECRYALESLTGQETNDLFYDTAEFTNFKENKYIRRRDDAVWQVRVNPAESCHMYTEAPLPKDEQLLPEFLNFCCRRKFLSNDIYVDEVFYPVSYKVVTIKADLASIQSVTEPIKVIMSKFKEIADCPLDIDSISDSPFLDLLIAGHLFPTPSKFMFCLKCIDPFLYNDIFRKADRSMEIVLPLIDKMVKNESIQSEKAVKEYIWDMLRYPDYFYIHYKPNENNRDNIIEFHGKLRNWKEEFLADEDASFENDEWCD
jgi:hypothetical protein